MDNPFKQFSPQGGSAQNSGGNPFVRFSSLDEEQLKQRRQSIKARGQFQKHQKNQEALGIAEEIQQQGDLLQPEEVTSLYESLVSADAEKLKALREQIKERGNVTAGERVTGFLGDVAKAPWEAADRLVVQPIDALASGDENKTNIQGDIAKAEKEHEKRRQAIDKRQKSGGLTEQQAEILKRASLQRQLMETGDISDRAAWAGTDSDNRLRIAAGAGIEAGASVAGGIGVKSLAKGAIKGLGGRQAAQVGARSISPNIGSQTIRATGFGAAQGGGIGLGISMQGDEFSAGEAIKSTAIGAGIGGTLGAGLSVGAQYAAKRYGRYAARKSGRQPITDKSRLLPERASPAAEVITDKKRLLQAGQQDPKLAVISHGADVADVQRLQKVESQLAEAQLNPDRAPITADQARSLIRERRQLLTRIQDPNNPVAKEMSDIDRKLAQAQEAGETDRVVALGNDRSYLEQQAAANATSKRAAQVLTQEPTTPYDPKIKTSSVAAKTEAKAISENLSQGYEGMAVYTNMGLDDQAEQVVKFMNDDYEAAKKVALGQAPAPEGIQSSSVYKGVESRAIREGDAEMMERLATESAIPEAATKMGQYNAAFAYKDPESPVTAFRSIMDARKNSKLDIPQTITKQESDDIVRLAQQTAEAKAAIANGGDRMAYGRARVAYDNYVNQLIDNTKKGSLKEALKNPREAIRDFSVGDAVTSFAGVTKSLRAAWDNSVLLRQGWKTLFTHPGTWFRNSRKTFSDFFKAAGNKPAMDEVRADIISRPNSINGMYKKMGVDVFGISEEAFPSSLPEKIPIAGRAFKGSEAAYTGFLQRTRADLADKYIEIAQRSGVNLTSKKELTSIGKLVNSLGSRGDVGRLGERAARTVNNVFFSPRLLKSNIDVLTAHQFQKGVTPFVRKQAAKNLLQIALGSAAAIKLASEVTGGKTEYDPRSANFGKIQIGNTRFDLTGGMGSIATFGSRLATTSSKSSTTGEVTKLNSGEFGSQTTLDTVYNFFENKTSPAASVVRDHLKGEDFEGDKPTVMSSAKNLVLPLIIDSYEELKESPDSASVTLSLIAEGLGISVNTYGLDSNWATSTGKKIEGFKKSVGEKKFTEANDNFNKQFNDWYKKVSSDEKFWKLPQEKRKNLVSAKRASLAEEVMRGYGYKYQTEKTDHSTELLIDELKNL